MECSDLVVKSYISKALEDQDFVTRNITVTGFTGKSEGYASHITFATVAITTEGGIEKNIEIAVKTSKESLMEKYERVYAREAYLYKTVSTEFTRFQIQNNIKHIFDSIPKCYNTISDEKAVVIVMENLRKNGYSLYDRLKPLDLDHMRLVLREYGKFHAISFALRDKCKDTFEKITTEMNAVSALFFNELKEAINESMKIACDNLKESGETELFEAYREINERGLGAVMTEAVDSVEPETAILHGDCWNNNFLYKYEDDDHKFPSKVAILDWQLSMLHSPALDLSYFIYSNSSEEQLKHYDELLDVYYTSFSTFLEELGCDSDKLFPFSTFQKHMKKYSIYGLVMVVTFLRIFLCDKEDAPDFSEARDANAMAEEIMNVKIKNNVEYRKRLIAVLSHYRKYI